MSKLHNDATIVKLSMSKFNKVRRDLHKMCFILKTHAYFVIVVLLFEIGYHNAAKAYPKFTIYTAQNGFELIILLYPPIECSHDKTVSPPLTKTGFQSLHLHFQASTKRVLSLKYSNIHVTDLYICTWVDLMNSVARCSSSFSVQVVTLHKDCMVTKAPDPNITFTFTFQLHTFAYV